MMEMKHIYLDNSATTALCPSALAKLNEAALTFGNPSSRHRAGQEAATLLQHARQVVGRSLGCRMLAPGELIFTSCGSEANSLAILGTVYAKERRLSNRIITTDSEHASVEALMQLLEKQGFDVVRIPTKGGVLDLDELQRALEQPVLLVSMMLVNNETGALYDLKTAFAMAKSRCPQVITHTDAVQGYLKHPFTPAALGADLVTVSAHKVHGPKGVGALYVNPALRKAKKIVPYLYGGGQEEGLRSGTENTLGIAAFSAAVEAALPSLEQDIAAMRALRTAAVEQLSQLDGVKIKQPLGACAPHILNLTLPGIKSEVMLHFLDAKGICVSSGSACASHGNKQSGALLAFGATPQEADCSLRVSFCSQNTVEDVTALCQALSEGLATLVRMRR